MTPCFGRVRSSCNTGLPPDGSGGLPADAPMNFRIFNDKDANVAFGDVQLRRQDARHLGDQARLLRVVAPLEDRDMRDHERPLRLPVRRRVHVDDRVRPFGEYVEAQAERADLDLERVDDDLRRRRQDAIGPNAEIGAYFEAQVSPDLRVRADSVLAENA